MSAVATDPPLCQYDRGYSVCSEYVVSADATDPRCVSMTEATRL